jgi:hypothetical protein
MNLLNRRLQKARANKGLFKKFSHAVNFEKNKIEK